MSLICARCGKTIVLSSTPNHYGVCAKCGVEGMTEEEKALVDNSRPDLRQLEDEINIGYACRALLGGGKGLSVMQVILANDPVYYERIMAEAKKRLNQEVPSGNAPKL